MFTYFFVKTHVLPVSCIILKVFYHVVTTFLCTFLQVGVSNSVSFHLVLVLCYGDIDD